MIIAFAIPVSVIILYLIALTYMLRVPPDSDKFKGPVRPGLAAELAAQRTKKRNKRKQVRK